MRRTQGLRLLLAAALWISTLPVLAQTQAERASFLFSHGAIIRTDTTVRQIHLVFTGHEFANGGETIRAVLKKHDGRASFFLTGDFYRNPAFTQLIRGLAADGHDLGPHSDKHLLYCAWENRDSTLVTRDAFMKDVEENLAAMKGVGVREQLRIFLPAFEWYNDTIASWTHALGMTLVNFTPGTYSNADYTTPDMGRQYVPSDTIVTRILRYESTHASGLNGFILLMHIGVDPKRTDVLHERLDGLLTTLQKRGYIFTSLSSTIH